MAEAQITEARDGPAAALGHLRQLCADLEARPGLLLGDPALAAWLARTALAAGDGELAASAARAAQALADDHPGFPALAAAAAHSRGLACRDPARLAQAATQHPDPWARASAAEDLGVLHASQGDRDQAIGHLKDALGEYRQVGADRDQARIRRRLRQLGIRRRHWSHGSRQARHRVGQPDRHRASRGRPGRRGTEQQPGRRPHVHQHPHRRPPPPPGLPQAQHRLPRRTHPHRHRAGGGRPGAINAAGGRRSGVVPLPGHPAAPPAQRPVAETVVYLRGPGTMVCCRNCSGMLMVISQIRGVTVSTLVA